ncbi:MAG: helix-turn-helix domain-containing protein, partial [Fibromonadaceae bacterium]|nr:helix-turn-helix domain-containing protein [Fibromonadaceae bacterium]
MKFNFGEKMKNLRKKRDLTQEQLAEYLGVSFQAVSKWETNAAYPDISLFPIIANFYGVTTDELLGVDVTKAKEKQKEYIKGTRNLYRQWKLAEMVELARKACLEFPGNHGILSELSLCLYHANSLSAAYLDESIDISKKILEESTDIKLRHSAAMRIIYCYQEKGEKEKASEYANQLLNNEPTRKILAERLNLYQGQQEIEYEQQCILLYYEFLAKVMTQYADANYHNAENKLSYTEKIEIFENVLKIQQIIYGDDLCDQHFDAYRYNLIINCFYLLMDE